MYNQDVNTDNWYHCDCDVCGDDFVYRTLVKVTDSGLRVCKGCLRDTYFLAQEREGAIGYRVSSLPNAKKIECTCETSERIVLVNVIKTNMAQSISLMCWRCGAVGYHIKHCLIKEAGIDIESIPIFVDNSSKNKCGVKGCTNKGAELHHYAPWSLWDNANDWTTGYLCKAHHYEWHKKTKTGSFRKKGQL